MGNCSPNSTVFHPDYYRNYCSAKGDKLVIHDSGGAEGGVTIALPPVDFAFYAWSTRRALPAGPASAEALSAKTKNVNFSLNTSA